MTTQRPTFGKKTSAAAPVRSAARRAPSGDLSPQAAAFLERERQSSGKRPYEETSIPFASPSEAVGSGKPVWGRRIFARLVDEFLVWFLVYLFFHDDIGRQLAIYLEAAPGTLEKDAAAIALFGYALIWSFLECIYNIVMESSRYQATLGKMMVGAVVTDQDGGKPGLGGIVMRNTIGRFIVNVIPFYAGYMMGVFRKDRRCMHDLVSSTMVRKRMPAGAISGNYGEVFA